MIYVCTNIIFISLIYIMIPPDNIDI